MICMLVIDLVQLVNGLGLLVRCVGCLMDVFMFLLVNGVLLFYFMLGWSLIFYVLVLMGFYEVVRLGVQWLFLLRKISDLKMCSVMVLLGLVLFYCGFIDVMLVDRLMCRLLVCVVNGIVVVVVSVYVVRLWIRVWMGIYKRGWVVIGGLLGFGW